MPLMFDWFKKKSKHSEHHRTEGEPEFRPAQLPPRRPEPSRQPPLPPTPAVKASAPPHKRPWVYDKAKWHYGGNFPKGLADYQGFVHTGMFVGWLIDHDMIADEFLAETARFRSGELTGTQVYELWDGALVDDMLTEEGNRFAKVYFDLKLGHYMKDYREILSRGLPTEYHVQDTRENYERLKQRIDQRYEIWKKSQAALS